MLEPQARSSGRFPFAVPNTALARSASGFTDRFSLRRKWTMVSNRTVWHLGGYHVRHRPVLVAQATQIEFLGGGRQAQQQWGVYTQSGYYYRVRNRATPHPTPPLKLH